MTASLPNPWISNSVESSPADALTVFSFSNPGPSLATGMSGDTANVGGDHEEVTASSLEHRLKTAPEVETTSLRLVPVDLDTRRTGTGPGTSGPERDIIGATNSSVSGLDPTRAAIVFGCMTSWLRTEVRDINNHIALRNLASNSAVIPST